MRGFKGECTHFSFNNCPIYTHDGASYKFSTNSHVTDNSVCPKIFLLASLCPKGSGIHTTTPFLGENFVQIDFSSRARLSVYLNTVASCLWEWAPLPTCHCEWCINVYISDSAQYTVLLNTRPIYSIYIQCTKLGTNSFRLKLHSVYLFCQRTHCYTNMLDWSFVTVDLFAAINILKKHVKCTSFLFLY